MDPIPNTLRYRVNHVWTKSSGWRFETTVEIVGLATDVIDIDDQLERALRRVDDLARAEARTRTQIDEQQDEAA